MRNKGSALLKGITKFALATALFMGIALFTGLVPVAKAADSRVSTLEALRNAVNAGGKIVLEEDISLDSDASDTDKSDNYLTINSNTVLDLNGHRIYRELSSVATNGYIIYVPANRSLTILDSAGGGGLTGGNSIYTAIRPSAVYVRGTLVLNGGSIYNNRNTARGGGAVVVEGGSFTMNGGEICGNEGNDGGVVIANGRFTMNGGSIHGNNGTSNAGGVYMTNNATNVFTMNGGYIRDNTCRDRGAGVYVQDGKFTLNGGQIRGNRINSITSSAIGCGGGVYVEYGSFTMTGGSITGNSAYPGSASVRGESGGGVYLSSNSSGATISGGRITGNTTGVGDGSSMQSGNGAGIYVGSRLTVSGAPVIAGNTQDGRPNDLYLKSGKLAIGEGGLQAGASIGIMHYEHNGKFSQPSPTTFTEGLRGNTGVFFANAFYYNKLNKTYEYAIQMDGDEAQLTYVGDSDLTVTFMRGDGTDAVHATQRVIPGGSASRPAEPVWNGHVFEGWHTDAVAATPYAFGGELTDNLTLYAHWVESATVTFHANGGMGGMEPQVFGKGLEQNLNPSLFFRDYYIFDGWTANADGTGAKYADRSAITVTEDADLYARWKAVQVTVTFKVINGAWDDSNADERTVTLSSQDGDALRLAADQIPAVGSRPKDGFMAGGWDVPPDTRTALNQDMTYTYTYVEKEAATVTKAPAANTLTYSGEAQALVTAGEATGGEMQYALGNETAATQPYTISIPTATNAGTYYVWYKVVGDDNHNDSAPACVRVVIKKQGVDPGVPTDALVYNGKEQPLVKAGSVEGGTLVYALGKDGKTAPTKGWSKAVPTEKDAGTYYVWYKVQGDKNHNDTVPVALEAEIARKPLVVTPWAKYKTYGWVDPELTWRQKGLIEGDPLAVTLKRDKGENVGEYAITVAKYEASDNYDVSVNEAVFTIKVRNVTVTARDQTIVKGAAIDKSVGKARLSGQVKGHVLSAVKLTAKGSEIIAGGAKIADADGVDVTGNYSITYAAGKLTVKPKPTVTPKPTAKPTVKPTVTPKPTVKPTVTPKPTPTPRPAADPDFTLLARLTVSGDSKTALKLAWTKVKGADGYDVYFARCNKRFKLKKTVKASESRTVRFKGLDKRVSYKGYVKAWKKVGGKKVYIGKASPQVHAITGGYTNHECNTRSVKLNKTRLTLKVGRSSTLKAKLTGLYPGLNVLDHVAKVRYYSSNANVASVSGGGKVKAVGKGTCTVYAIANNGVRAGVKVTVK